MKKRMVQSVLFLLIIGIVLVSFSEAAEGKPKSKIRYFSQNSVYVYGMGSATSFDSDFGYYPDLGVDRATTFAPVVGVGCRVVNFSNQFFLNLEFDYTPGRFDFSNRSNLKIDFYTFMLDLELHLSGRHPIAFFVGMGGSSVSVKDAYITYIGNGSYYYDGTDNRFVMVLEFGLKYPITKKLFFRSGFRLYGDVDSSYNNDYWYDEYDDESVMDPFSKSFSVGLEYHF